MHVQRWKVPAAISATVHADCNAPCLQKRGLRCAEYAVLCYAVHASFQTCPSKQYCTSFGKGLEEVL